jgi:predicted metal-dependent hydrolase
VSQKINRGKGVAELISALQGRELDARYLGYFECFNQRLFFEAHEVLEGLWLGERGKADDAFYKGLIQFAGAFVHVQKGRVQPARSLLKLAAANLRRYAPRHQRLNVAAVLEMIARCEETLRNSGARSGSATFPEFPRLGIETG